MGLCVEGSGGFVCGGSGGCGHNLCVTWSSHSKIVPCLYISNTVGNLSSPLIASLFPPTLPHRYTWFDRDLGLAGRVLVRTPENPSVISHRLVKIDRPILRIPMLAIHLQRDIHTAGFKPNLQVRAGPFVVLACMRAVVWETE